MIKVIDESQQRFNRWYLMSTITIYNLKHVKRDRIGREEISTPVEDEIWLLTSTSLVMHPSKKGTVLQGPFLSKLLHYFPRVSRRQAFPTRSLFQNHISLITDNNYDKSLNDLDHPDNYDPLSA